MIKKLVSSILLFTFVTSCVETVVIASATTSVIVVREKSLSDMQKDTTISAKLGTTFFEKGLKIPGNSIDITVNEGRVLLTGIVDDVGRAKSASELAWGVPYVKEVIDEIQIQDNKKPYLSRFTTTTSDYVITANIETRLLLTPKISFTNYQITTVGKVVYVLGVALNNDEMQKVLSISAKAYGVEKVVNHAILADDVRRKSKAKTQDDKENG